jgi:DNA 3'-phosphatase
MLLKINNNMWNYEDDNKLLYFVSSNFTYKPNVAIFSLGKTLIKDTISKEKIPFMQLNDILPSLYQINENGSIIIIESGIKISRENLKLITKKFFDLIDNQNNLIPFIIMFPLKNNKFQKPYTQIFTKLQELYIAKEKYIITEKSIVIGNAAGRLKTNLYPPDYNDHDRAFASNIGVAFKTPEQFLNNESVPRQWMWYNDNINKFLLDQKSLLEPSFDNIFKPLINTEKKYIIFITGAPTSGKTLLSNRVKQYLDNFNDKNFKDKDIKIFDINNYSNVQQMLPLVKSSINACDNIIIADILETETKRNNYFHLIDNLENYKIYYIEIDVSRELCEFLNLFKLQISRSIFEIYPKYIYNNYYNNYKPISTNHKKNLSVYISFPLILRSKKEIYYHY